MLMTMQQFVAIARLRFALAAIAPYRHCVSGINLLRCLCRHALSHFLHPENSAASSHPDLRALRNTGLVLPDRTIMTTLKTARRNPPCPGKRAERVA